MIFWLLIGFALLGAAILFAKWYAQAPPAAAARAVKIGVGAIIGLFTLLLISRIGLPVLIASLIAVIPLLLGLRAQLRRARTTQGPSPGGASTVSSAWFEMALDHDDGGISGRVLKGEHAGASLDDLDEVQLDALAMACRDDMNSSRLLAAYLGRRFGRPEEEAFDEERAGASPGGAMTVEEAREILGLDAGADLAAVRAAYKRLIALAHPDRGGSAYLAAKINQARDVLVENLT